MKKRKQGIFVALFVCLMLFVLPTSAHAASLVQLKTGKTYTSYDVTRDGKKDKIKIVQSTSYASSGYTKMKVYVNGKNRFTAEGCKDCPVYIFKSGSKSVILSSFVFGDGGNEFYAYNYSSGKFKKSKIGSSGFFFAQAKKSGSYLKIYSQPKGTWWLNSFKNYMTMPFKAVNTYKISNGKLTKVTTYPTISGKTTYYAKYAFTTGKTITTVSAKKGPTVKKGQKVTLKSAYYRTKDHYYYYKISVNGKTGWFKDSSAIQFKT